MATEQTHYRLLDTPTGPFALMRCGDSISTAWVDSSSAASLETMKHVPQLLDCLAERLLRFFDGETVDFSDVPTPTGSSFRQRCWSACRTIARGRTLSYSALAAAAGGGSGAARAAGQAMRTNPLPIIIPCHRVIASDGKLGGFSGSSDINGTELNHKRFLLELEKALGTGHQALVPCATPEGTHT